MPSLNGITITDGNQSDPLVGRNVFLQVISLTAGTIYLQRMASNGNFYNTGSGDAITEVSCSQNLGFASLNPSTFRLHVDGGTAVVDFEVWG
jgi:hypothetical protein